MAGTAPTLEGIVLSARNMLRDFPVFFEVDLGPIQTSTIRLPHPNVDGETLQVYTAAQSGPLAPTTEHLTMSPVPATEWGVDERNGLLKFSSAAYQGQRVFIAGYHYEWFLNEDLDFSASLVVAEHFFKRHQTLDTISPVELDVIAMGTVVRALWALITDFSTDIDVNSPEGMFIPARQRFQQVWQMLQHWEGLYNDRAKSLNVGLSNIDVFNLRRVAKMTGRFVPVYKDREYDDHEPPTRVRPEIPDLITSEAGPGSGGDTLHTVEEIGRESADLGFGGWQSGGTNGGI